MLLWRSRAYFKEFTIDVNFAQLFDSHISTVRPVTARLFFRIYLIQLCIYWKCDISVGYEFNVSVVLVTMNLGLINS